MKKNLLIIICIFTGFIQAMEENFFSIVHHKTTINLTKGSLFDADGKVDFIVIGKNQQYSLQKPQLNANLAIGEICYTSDQIVYEKNDNSDSDDDTYKPYIPHSVYKKKLWTAAHQKTILDSAIISIIEPQIVTSQYYDEQQDAFVEHFYYQTTKKDPKNKNPHIFCENHGAKAIEETSKDLATCYRIVLTKHFLQHPHKKNSIALPTLGTDIGFPRITAAPLAIAAIFGFIKDFPTAYDRIELFVEKRFEFELYKNLLLQYIETT